MFYICYPPFIPRFLKFRPNFYPSPGMKTKMKCAICIKSNELFECVLIQVINTYIHDVFKIEPFSRQNSCVYISKKKKIGRVNHYIGTKIKQTNQCRLSFWNNIFEIKKNVFAKTAKIKHSIAPLSLYQLCINVKKYSHARIHRNNSAPVGRRALLQVYYFVWRYHKK